MKENIITVQGVGRLSIEPDTAVIRCKVSALNKSYTGANQEMNQRVDLLRQALTAEGFAKTDLKTTDFGMTRETKRNPKTDEYEFSGFNAAHALELRLPLDKARVNRVMEALLGSKAEAQVDIAFAVADPEPVRQRLLTAAVENARQRAETIARAAGTKLGKIAHISYGVAEVQIRQTESMLCDSPAGPEIEAGNYTVQDSVTVTWEILG